MKKKNMPYAILDDKGDIIGFKPDAPMSALVAAKDHIEMSIHFDDISNAEWWEKKIKALGLDKI